MSVITRTLVLVGAYAGKTIALKVGTNEYEFTDGKLEITGPSADVDNLSKFLLRSYQAYPEGSKELEAAQAAIEEALADAPETEEDGAAEGSDDPGGTDDETGGAGDGTAEPPASGDGSGDGEANDGEAGAGDADGDGPSPIVEALKKLDANDDEAWTADGKPKMAAVEAVLGRTDVTRAQVEEALPGFNREAARAAG